MTGQFPAHVVVASDQVTAGVQNADGTANVYITDDPKQNILTLTLANGLGTPIVFPPGTPVAYEDLPSGQSAVYLYFNGLIDNADIANMKLAAPGWAAATFTDSNSLQYLVIAPDSQVTVQPGGELTANLTNVLVPGQPRSGTADILLAGAENVKPVQRDVPLFVNIANPPQPHNKTLGLQAGFQTTVVYTVPAQSLLLYLVNVGDAPLVPGGTPDWHGVTPTFQLTFVYGDGTGALTTVGAAVGMSMSISNDYGNVWQPPQPRNQDVAPYWIMQPDPHGGGTVLGTGENATIVFEVAGIDPSPLPDGLDSALTVAYLSWYDIPGYNDGFTSLVITKKPVPRVTTFTADPGSVPYGAHSVQTVLTWDTEHATGVRFDAPGVGPAQNFGPSGGGPLAGPLTVPSGSTLTVTAYKDISKERHGAAGGGGPSPADTEITATAKLRIGGATRADIPAGIGPLGAIVVPAGTGKAFLFQMNIGGGRYSSLPKAAVLDIATGKITATANISPVIPTKGGGTQIDGAVATPDGKTIHVLASSGQGMSNLTPEYYIVPLDVASVSYGQPVQAPASPPDLPAPRLLATLDGRTVYFAVWDEDSRTLPLWALDPASYQIRHKWTWQPSAADQHWISLGCFAACCDADGSAPLIVGFAGVGIVKVGDVIAGAGTLNTGDSLKLAITQSAVSADATRAYLFAVDALQEPIHASMLAVDLDLAAGTLSLARDAKLGQVPLLAGPSAVSLDGRTFYLLTAPDILTAFDTATFAAVPYSCGGNGEFTPLLLVPGAQPDVFYTTGSAGYGNSTVSVLTIS